MIKLVPTVALKLLHVELHPADLIGVIVRGHEHVAVLAGDNDVNGVSGQGKMVKVTANRKPVGFRNLR